MRELSEIRQDINRVDSAIREQSLLYQLHEELPYIKVIGSYCVPNE